jgi:hypothetical protein
MKNTILLAVFLIAGQFLTGQESIMGFNEIQMDGDLKSLKPLFLPQKVMGYFLEKEFEDYNKEFPGAKKESDYKKDYYRVAPAQTKYFTFFTASVLSIDVSENYSNKVCGITIALLGDEKNMKLFLKGLETFLGKPPEQGQVVYHPGTTKVKSIDLAIYNDPYAVRIAYPIKIRQDGVFNDIVVSYGYLF